MSRPITISGMKTVTIEVDMRDIFTERERKVFHMLMNGKTIGEIADEFYVTKLRIEQICNRIYEKMGGCTDVC